MKKLFLLIVLISSGSLLSACGSWWLPRAHKIEIQQGNILPDEVVTGITEGMTRTEVVNLLGSPVSESSRTAPRWDYIYSRGKSGNKPAVKRLTLFFENDRIVQIQKDGFDTGEG
jgi:outer membrane protein assembly factor BamE